MKSILKTVSIKRIIIFYALSDIARIRLLYLGGVLNGGRLSLDELWTDNRTGVELFSTRKIFTRPLNTSQ